MDKFTEVFFDVETQKFFSDIQGSDPGELGISVVSVYRRKIDLNYKELEGKMQSFWEDELEKMWPFFLEADRIIGFNTIKFDIPALRPYAPGYFAKLPHFDIYNRLKRETGHGASLNSIAKLTLGTQKSDSGVAAIEYWAKHDKESLAKLKHYCEDDVIITKEIYDYVLTNKKLKFTDRWNNPREVKLDFSYPKEKPTDQNTLF